MYVFLSFNIPMMWIRKLNAGINVIAFIGKFLTVLMPKILGGR